MLKNLKKKKLCQEKINSKKNKNTNIYYLNYICFYLLFILFNIIVIFELNI